MLSEARKTELANLLRPVAPPRILQDVYTPDQIERLMGVMHDEGPWKLIIAQHFASAEELLATSAGSLPEGFTPTLDMFMTPVFRGFLANYSALLYPQIQDCFYNPGFLEHARSYWGAKYAKPQMMLFNVSGPYGCTDPGHLDSPSFRGVRYENSPTWLCSVMGKSGLFRDYLIKCAQVITWTSPYADGGFTYWPDGPFGEPQRLPAPMWNTGCVVQNEMMVHRGEACGPLEKQRPAGLDFTTTFGGDPGDREAWVLRTGEREIAGYRTNELRYLFHWTGEVFMDLDELRKNMDGTDDITPERAIERLIDDVRSRGIAIETPTDPLHDATFIRALNAAYDIGGPRIYPPEAPVTPLYLAA